MQQLKKKRYIIYLASTLLDMFHFVLSGILSDKEFCLPSMEAHKA